MSPSLIAAALWAVIANVIGMIPAKNGHWPAAWGLVVVGIPIVGWVTFQNGAFIGLAVLAAGASVLRWPLRYLLRWIRQTLVTKA